MKPTPGGVEPQGEPGVARGASPERRLTRPFLTLVAGEGDFELSLTLREAEWEGRGEGLVSAHEAEWEG